MFQLISDIFPFSPFSVAFCVCMRKSTVVLERYLESNFAVVRSGEEEVWNWISRNCEKKQKQRENWKMFQFFNQQTFILLIIGRSLHGNGLAVAVRSRQILSIAVISSLEGMNECEKQNLKIPHSMLLKILFSLPCRGLPSLIFLHKARPMAILKSFPNTREGKKWNVNGMNARGKREIFPWNKLNCFSNLNPQIKSWECLGGRNFLVFSCSSLQARNQIEI